MIRSTVRCLFIVACGLIPVWAAPNAVASWQKTSDSPIYSYSNSPALDEDVYKEGVLVGHRKRGATNGSCYAKVTSWGAQKGDGTPVAHTIDVVSYSILKATTRIVGFPPPTKPTTWPQASWLSGTNYVEVDENQTIPGVFDISATGRLWIPTQAHQNYVATDEAGSSHPAPVQESRNLAEAVYYNRPIETAYNAAEVRASVHTYVNAGQGGEVVAYA